MEVLLRSGKLTHEFISIACDIQKEARRSSKTRNFWKI